MSEEAKYRMAQELLGQLEDLAGAFNALDPVAGQALLAFAILARCGREDLILSFVSATRKEVAALILQAYTDVHLIDATHVD